MSAAGSTGGLESGNGTWLCALRVLRARAGAGRGGAEAWQGHPGRRASGRTGGRAGIPPTPAADGSCRRLGAWDGRIPTARASACARLSHPGGVRPACNAAACLLVLWPCPWVRRMRDDLQAMRDKMSDLEIRGDRVRRHGGGGEGGTNRWCHTFHLAGCKWPCPLHVVACTATAGWPPLGATRLVGGEGREGACARLGRQGWAEWGGGHRPATNNGERASV